MLKILSRLAPQQAWTSEWLHANLRRKYPQGMTLGKYFMEYKGQPNGAGTEHRWAISTKDFEERTKLENAIKQKQNGIVITNKQQNNQYTSFKWKGFQLRSEAEQKIAEELEKRNILFFVNAKCRLPDKNNVSQTREIDFIIFYKGQYRILEVDGREYHQTAAQDHKRDRLLEKHGLRTTRFTGKECFHTPNLVIEEFLELFEFYTPPNKSTNQTKTSNIKQITDLNYDDTFF